MGVADLYAQEETKKIGKLLNNLIRISVRRKGCLRSRKKRNLNTVCIRNRRYILCLPTGTFRNQLSLRLGTKVVLRRNVANTRGNFWIFARQQWTTSITSHNFPTMCIRYSRPIAGLCYWKNSFYSKCKRHPAGPPSALHMLTWDGVPHKWTQCIANLPSVANFVSCNAGTWIFPSYESRRTYGLGAIEPIYFPGFHDYFLDVSKRA